MVASGLTGFDNYCRNLLFSFLVVAFPIVIESFVQQTLGQKSRRYWTALFCLLAAISFCCWVLTFAQTFSLSGTSASELATALTKTLTGHDADNPLKVNNLTVFQIISEVLVASICALELRCLCENHRVSERRNSESYKKTEKDFAAWRRLQRDEAELLGAVQGRIEEIEHGMKLFTNRACALFDSARPAAEWNRDVRALLDNSTEKFP
jgi:hypothetical protein